MIPSIPYLLSIAREYEGVSDEIEVVENYISAIFNIGFGLGSFLGPIFFSAMVGPLGFRYLIDFSGFATIIWVVIYGVFLCVHNGPKSLSSYRINSETSVSE